MIRLFLVCASLLLSGVAEAACVNPKPVDQSGNIGSPFATRGVTGLGVQTSDNAKITGGCIDGAPVGENTPAAGTFTTLSVLDQWRGPIFSPVTDHGADRTGAVAAQTAFSASVADCAAAGGGIIDVPQGTYKLTSAVSAISTSGCRYYFHNATIAPSGTAAFTALQFDGIGPGAVLTLTADATQDTKSFTVAATTGLSVGGYVIFERDAPNNGGAADKYKFISTINAISGLTVTLTNSFPVTFATADTGLVVAPWTPITKVGIDGSLTCDGSNHSVGQLICISPRNTAFSTFRHIHGVNVNPGVTFYGGSTASGYGGYANHYENISALNGSGAGAGGPVAIGFTGDTLAKIANISVTGGVLSSFGAQIQEASYPSVLNVTSVGTSQVDGQGRNIKIQSTANGTFTNLTGNAGGDTGIAISVGSTRNVLSNLIANDNRVSQGVWFSDQYNTANMVYGISAHGNATQDLFVGATDTGNIFFGVDAGVITNNGSARIVDPRQALTWNKQINVGTDSACSFSLVPGTSSQFQAVGTNCTAYLSASGNGQINFSNADGIIAVFADTVGTVANQLIFRAAATLGEPSIQAFGGDTDVNLSLFPRGTGFVRINGSLRLPNYTVATLPTCDATHAYVMAVATDAAAPTYNGALTGGGGVKVPVFCDGAAWTSH